MSLHIRPVEAQDAAAICQIYNHYIEQSCITFEEQPVSLQTMEERTSGHPATHPWLVATINEQLIGYAYATPWKTRSAYRFSVETSVYLSHFHVGQGTGKQLYLSLIAAIKASGFHRLNAGIALPNEASIGLHEHLGFIKVAHFTEVGFKHNRWIDVGYWEKAL
ncbi:arsinothricin resistance N-acetyltransferase ArsN1 family B [Pokkaliibacter sp. CJK22405]|uniref:arsinothricin resistance N-acetyltransferase ArsN1 family B n=1 Tax=Pokkaliibacter sp. CJK22405 TaxID=3384615 RepID=UPI003984EDC5